MAQQSPSLEDRVKLLFDLTSFTVLSQSDDVISGQGMRLVQLNRSDLGSLSGIYAELPVDIVIKTRDLQSLKGTHVEDVSEDDINDAVLHVRRLQKSGQLHVDPEAANSKATHAIETDSMGRRILVRARYS